MLLAMDYESVFNFLLEGIQLGFLKIRNVLLDEKRVEITTLRVVFFIMLKVVARIRVAIDSGSV